jgi:tripartite-type tricarboxylate transporter receptor subunit TctC
MDSPIKTFKDFIEEARKRELTIAGSGRTAADIAMDRLAVIAKLKLKIVPFGGMSTAITAILGGQTDAIVNSGYYQYVRSGKLRLLCLTTGMKNKEFPEIPTLKELGYDIEVPAFYGIIAPKGLPEQIRKRLEEAFTRAVRDPSFAPIVHNAGWEFVYRNGEDFGNHVKEMYKRSEKECRELGLGKYAKEKK